MTDLFGPIDTFNVLSLFDGMSCGQIALNRAGIKYDKYFASEIDKNAIKVTQHNYPNTMQVGDVTKLSASALPQISLLMGGSPCQGFSSAGRGLNFDDPRSKLFFEFVRLKNELNPRYFLLENVDMKKEWRDIISSYLGVEPVFINSSDFSAQNRKRWYWTNIAVAEWLTSDVVLKDVLDSNTDAKYVVNKELSSLYNGGNNLNPAYKSQCNHIHDVSKKARTLCAGSSGYSHGYLHMGNKDFRRFTPDEWERLQTVPNGYTEVVSDTARYKMLGNGWTVDVIAHIMRGIEQRNVLSLAA